MHDKIGKKDILKICKEGMFITIHGNEEIKITDKDTLTFIKNIIKEIYNHEKSVIGVRARNGNFETLVKLLNSDSSNFIIQQGN